MSPRVRPQREKFKLQPKYWLLILTIISVLLMSFTFLTDVHFNAANFVVGYTIVPFQKAITVAGTFFKDRAEMLAKIKDLQEENATLQAQVDQLTIDNAILQQEK